MNLFLFYQTFLLHLYNLFLLFLIIFFFNIIKNSLFSLNNVLKLSLKILLRLISKGCKFSVSPTSIKLYVIFFLLNNLIFPQNNGLQPYIKFKDILFLYFFFLFQEYIIYQFYKNIGITPSIFLHLYIYIILIYI